MKKAIIWNEETFVEDRYTGGRWGSTAYIDYPYQQKFERIYETTEELRETTHEEIEYKVVNKVFSHTERYGAMLERFDEDFYIQKDVLTRGLTDEELKFMNGYRNRFLLLTNNKQDYIFDNNTLKTYKVENIDNFKDFKDKLKELNLI